MDFHTYAAVGRRSPSHFGASWSRGDWQTPSIGWSPGPDDIWCPAKYVYASHMWWQSWLSTLADILSILGFCLTVFVAFRVNAIRKEYVLLGRAPTQVAELQKKAGGFILLWNGVPSNRRELIRALGDIEVSLRSLRTSLSGDLRRTAGQLHRDVRRFQGLPSGVRRVWTTSATSVPEITHDDAYSLYNELIKLVDSVEEDIKNQNWTR